MNLYEESLAHLEDTIEYLNKKLVNGVYPNHHYGRMVLLVRGLPPEVTIYIDDPTIGDGYTARLSHDGPDRYYGTCRHFTTLQALTLWLKRKIIRETELVNKYKDENPNWRRWV